MRKITTYEGNKNHFVPTHSAAMRRTKATCLVTPGFFSLLFFCPSLSSIPFLFLAFSHLDSRHFIIDIAWSRHGKACISLNVGA
jgi:hypothetical protein